MRRNRARVKDPIRRLDGNASASLCGWSSSPSYCAGSTEMAAAPKFWFASAAGPANEPQVGVPRGKIEPGETPSRRSAANSTRNSALPRHRAARRPVAPPLSQWRCRRLAVLHRRDYAGELNNRIFNEIRWSSLARCPLRLPRRDFGLIRDLSKASCSSPAHSSHLKRSQLDNGTAAPARLRNGQLGYDRSDLTAHTSKIIAG